MILNGIVFDDIKEDELSKFEYGTIKEKGKHPVKFLWLSHYEYDPKKCESYCERHILECSSRGSVTLDGHKIKDQKENDEAAKFFEMKIFS